MQWKKSAEPGAISQTTRSHLASANETRSRSAHISLRPAPNSPQPVSKQRLHRPDSLLHAATAATVCAVLYVCDRCVCVGVWVGGWWDVADRCRQRRAPGPAAAHGPADPASASRAARSTPRCRRGPCRWPPGSWPCSERARCHTSTRSCESDAAFFQVDRTARVLQLGQNPARQLGALTLGATARRCRCSARC